MTPDYLDLSARIFDKAKYQATDLEVENLAVNMKLLEQRGLSKLNSRLLDSNNKIHDTLAEHNFATKLLLRHGKQNLISYEPEEGLRRPPDFKVNIGEKVYWIQMKKLSRLERENRHRKIENKIINGVRGVQVGMFYECLLAEDFSEIDINNLIDFIVEHSINPVEGKRYYFFGDNPKASVEFWYPKRIELSSLTYGSGGDMNMVNVTGLAHNQIIGSITNAAGAFDWETSPNIINLIAMDIDNYDDINICNAIFGSEFDCLSLNSDNHSWGRKSDGIFFLPELQKRVAGVIGLRRKNDSLVTDYYAQLFVNESFKDFIDVYDDLLYFDKIIYRNMRPPMGKGFFEFWV